MKVRKQVPPGQLGLHRQRSGQSWKNCRLFSIKTRLNWSTTLPTKALFKTLRGQIPTDAEEILFQAAHLESRQLQYQKAAQRLADRATHAQLSEEMMKVKLLADEKHKNIGILQSLGDVLKQKISDLSPRREALLAELKQVEDALSQA